LVFIGSRLALCLCDQGYQVSGVARRSAKVRRLEGKEIKFFGIEPVALVMARRWLRQEANDNVVQFRK
jgi:nucleoside-diphosphate-sugar epimerase